MNFGGFFDGMGGAGAPGGAKDGGIDNKRYYELLGVSKNANEAQIKKAYRKLAVKEHPDKGGDAEKFKEISKAYKTLSDPQTRAAYDKFGEEGTKPGMGGPGDMFGGMFG